MDWKLSTANQGARADYYPPFSWPGGSMIVDFDGRLLAQADSGPGEKIVVGPIDIAALREERDGRRGHHMLAHLRMGTYKAYRKSIYLGGLDKSMNKVTIEGNEEAILIAKQKLRKDI